MWQTKLVVKLARALLPKPLRTSPIVQKLKVRLLGHNWVYDSDYYEEYIEGPAARSAGKIADSIVDTFEPRRVIDVGCGTGALLEALRDRGCEVLGLERSDAGLKYCRARRISVVKFDLERDVFQDQGDFDVVVSMEVAEHLPGVVADRFVDLLTQAGRVVVFTAAPPDQGGTGHVNEQPPEYWIRKFLQRGFEPLTELSGNWSEDWRASDSVAVWYHQNLMIFRRAE